MTAEAKELYFHIKNRFEEDLQRISPTCVSPIVAVRQVVKKAIDNYIIDYSSKGTKSEDIFTSEDFKEVSNKICDEIMNNSL